VFLALRIYCKLSRRRSLWWDDHFLVASWVSNRFPDILDALLTTAKIPKVALLVSTAMLTEGTKAGIGLHYLDMNLKYMPKMAWISYGAGFCATLATTWSKTSFGITLLRLSDGWVKWLIWFIIITTNLVHGFSAAMMWIQCWPVAKLWTPSMEGTCWPNSVVQDYQTAANGTQQMEKDYPSRVADGRLTVVYSGVLDLS
jgi:hypothetical protein